MNKKIVFVGIFVLSICLLAILLQPKNSKELKTFQSYEDLENYIKQNSFGYNIYGPRFLGQIAEVKTESALTKDYSKTNVQVEGIDEADIVKTDGEYIYSINGNDILIVKAYPVEEMKLISKIEMKDNPTQIFVSNDKLVVFGYKNYDYITIPEFPIFFNSKSFVKIYDISDKSSPTLLKEITITGSYIQSRMIDNNVYAVFAQNLYYYPPKPIPLPVISVDGVAKIIDPREIYYFDYSDDSYSFSTILALDVDKMNYKTKTFLLGNSQTIYASKNSIYMAYTKYYDIYDFYDKFVDKVLLPASPLELRQKIIEIKESSLDKRKKVIETQKVIEEYFSGNQDASDFYDKINQNYASFEKEISKEREKTIINKFDIDGLNIEFKGKADVAGHVLNQFSMDEYNNKFRVVTTIGFGESENNVYVFDEDMQLISKLEGIATGERIYSARFVNDKLYLVTFKQIDPFFVIDLSNEPKILGYLKLPGVSDYLHPYDETHIIGFGRDADEQGRIKGLKISLFDVSDFSSPKELYSYKFGEAGSYSEANYEHKAFLFSKEKNLLVIPASISDGTRFYPWQGAIVFNIDVDNGISLKGKIDHGKQQFWYNQIKRSLYIDNVLYTVSDSKIKANSLQDLSDLADVDFEEIIIPLK